MAFAMEHSPLVELSLDTAIPSTITLSVIHLIVWNSDIMVKLYLLFILGVEYFPRMCICSSE